MRSSRFGKVGSFGKGTGKERGPGRSVLWMTVMTVMTEDGECG